MKVRFRTTATLCYCHLLDEVYVNLASADDFLQDGSQKLFRVSVFEATLLALQNAKLFYQLPAPKDDTLQRQDIPW
jgi:hypothetical protein